MIITIIFIVLFIIGLILTFIFRDDLDTYFSVSVIPTMIGAAGIIVCVILILVVQIPKERDYENALYQKEVLEYRLENAVDLNGNELLYNDIVKFNNEIRNVKYAINNYWINWFSNDMIASIEYIDYKNLARK